MPKFVIDEDMPRSLGPRLRKHAYDVKDVRDHGLRGAPDEAIFGFAQREKAAILTADRGFGNILRFPLGSHFGIVVARFPNEMPVAEITRQLEERLGELCEDDFLGNVVVIEPGQVRVKRKER